MDTILRMIWYLALIPLTIAAGVCVWGFVSSVWVLIKPQDDESRDEAVGGLVWYGVVPLLFVVSYYTVRFIAVKLAGILGLGMRELSVATLASVVVLFAGIVWWRRRSGETPPRTHPRTDVMPRIPSRDEG